MHVVHLEDDGPLREILKVAFEAADPSVELHQFVSSNAAIEYIEKNLNEIDLFVLDIRVPGTMNGIQVAEKIRELNAQGAIVLTSAYQAPERDFLNKLQCEWFPKPWHIMETTKKLFELARKEPKKDSKKDTGELITKKKTDADSTAELPKNLIRGGKKPSKSKK